MEKRPDIRDRAESTPVSLKPSDKAMVERIRSHYSEQGFSQAIRRALLVTVKLIETKKDEIAA